MADYLDKIEEQEDEQKDHPDQGAGEGKAQKGKAIGSQVPDEREGDDQHELLEDLHRLNDIRLGAFYQKKAVGETIIPLDKDLRADRGRRLRY